ncbi:MAG TPA: glutathione S-transferase family protein [Steroidobacteraceae bacterium]|jgi:glutathione S-transferase|nr:glutathione S-transferase family protein [Steroidobacteraceae bacterium]HTG77853.1 glutathione S-transferase family protein [Steroidobacteraceae bacterium]
MTYRLYDYLPSGNGYKVRLVLRELELPHELVEVDILKGGSRTQEFLAKNPNGRIPVLEIPGKGYLWESHAIISYLADGSALIPTDALDRARMWQWLCFEQYNLEPNVATVRFWLHSLHKTEAELGEKLTDKRRLGFAALDVLERGLADRDYLVANRYTLADIGLYAYTHVAEEGGFPLERYPAIRGWCARIAARPGYRPITAK